MNLPNKFPRRCSSLLCLVILQSFMVGCATVESDSSPGPVVGKSTGPVEIEYSFTNGRRAELGPTSGANSGIFAGQMAVYAMVEGTEASMSTNRASAGYEGASGQYHVFLSELNPASSIDPFTPYISFTLEAEGDLAILLTGLEFGARSLCDPFESGSPSSGPTRYVLRTSSDGFSSDVVEGVFNGERGSSNFWHKYSHDGLTVLSGKAQPFELRLYLLGASGEERAGVFRIDDVAIKVSTRS